jgi:hypothetical protein
MAKIRVSMFGTEPRSLRNFSVMWTGYEQNEKKPGLHETNILVLKGEEVWEEGFPVAADMEVLAVKKPEAEAVEDMEDTVVACMGTEVDSEAKRVTSKIPEAVEPQVEAAETDLKSTTSMTKELLLLQETDK